MEKEKTKTNDEQEVELKTLEDVDKVTEGPALITPTETEDKDEQIKQLKDEVEKYKNKYTKAVEVNNQLYQRLTSKEQPQQVSALQGILNRF